jgi:hypothetical protein
VSPSDINGDEPGRPKRPVRLLIIGETPENRRTSDALAWAMKADEVVRLDVDSAPAVLEQVRRTPPDRVLVLGALWCHDEAGEPVETYAGRQVRRYLAGAFPVRWVDEGRVVDLIEMPGAPAPKRRRVKVAS